MTKYTADDIWQMREICRNIAMPWNDSISERELSARAEDYLRTYMQNGTTVGELRDECNRLLTERFNREKRDCEMMGQGASLSMFEPNPSAKIFLHPPEDDDG